MQNITQIIHIYNIIARVLYTKKAPDRIASSIRGKFSPYSPAVKSIPPDIF